MEQLFHIGQRIKTAQAIKYSLDKEQTSYDDLLVLFS
jgi:hypothetical protein